MHRHEMIRPLDLPDDIPCLTKRRRSSPDSGITDSDLFDAGLDQRNSSFEMDTPTSSSSSGPLLGLRADVRNYLCERRGIKDLYEWQHRCLSMLNQKKNLVITLPTGGGKTLVAEILILTTILQEGKDALFILPFVSLVQEKVKALQPLGLEFGFLVEEYASTRGRIPPIRRRVKKSVYVATIERSQSLVNSLIGSKRIHNMGLVIIDELHMVGEGQNRGARLEQVITTLHVAAKDALIIGLSATLSNVEEMTEFLKADVFTSDYRPVPLTEFVKLGNTVHKVKRPGGGSGFNEMLEHNRELNPACPTVDPDGISDLVKEVIPDASCLVFCPSKKNTESVALLLTKTLPNSLKHHRTIEKQSLISQLESEIVGGNLCPILRRSIGYGIAYHHAGLTTDERNLIQEAFANGTLCVICCTSTLAAGVNLPAKRVIFRAPLVGNSFLTKQQYRQMSGRAGRAGLDTSGESILVINGKQLSKTLDLLQGDVECCRSRLLDDVDLGRYLLSVIGLQLVGSKNELFQMLDQTLASIQQGKDVVILRADAVLSSLIDDGLVARERNPNGQDDALSLTEFGRAVLDSGISTDHAQKTRDHLLTSVQCLVLSTHLHLLYCIIPFDRQEDVKPRWDVFFDEYVSLGESEKKVFQVLKVSEYYLLARRTGATKTKGDMDEVAERLYLSLVIRRLWNEESIWSVSERFHIPRGVVQSLSQACAASASSLTRFVERMKDLWALKQLLPELSRRLTYCAKPELIPLMEIQGVKRARANQLYQAGFKTPADIAKTSMDILVGSIGHLSRRQAVQMITSAKMWMREKGELIVEQAEESGLSIEELLSTLSQAF